MKKRILAILCVLAVLVGVLAVTTAAKTPTFRVGYAKVDINPWVDPDDWTKGMLPIALSGYGESYARPAKGWMDDNGDGVVDDQDGLKATCIAVTDDNDKTMLFIAYDMINASDTQVKNVRTAIVKALGGAVAMDDIMISASHSHFSPDTGVSITKAEEHFDAEMAQKMKDALATWNQRVIDQMVVAAKTAMADRRVVSKVEKSQIDASDASGYTVNGVRHYNITGYSATQTDKALKTPTWTAGDNFGSMRDKDQYTYGSMAGYKITKVEHVTQSNDNLYMMTFSFEDGSQPILFANWRGHTTLNRHGRFYRANPGITDSLTGFDCISGDYFNAFRYRMELRGYRTALVNGASGNINNRSRASSTTNDWSTIWMAGELVVDGKKVPNTFKMVNGEPVFECTKLKTDESSSSNLYNKSTALGLLLASIAEKGLDPTNKHAKIETCQAGSIRNIQVRYGMAPHTFGEELDGLLYAISVFEADEKASSANNGKGLFPYSARWNVEDGGDGKLYTLNSRFHVSTVKARAGAISESVAKLELNAIMLGPNLAFVSGPGELYDYYDAAGSTKAADNDWLELITEQYGTPFVLGYSNGSHSYIPNTKAFDYNKAWAERGLPLGRGAYGANIAQIAQGGGEAMIAEFKRMLNIINDDSTIRTAKCDHCGKTVEWEPLIRSNNSDNYMYTGHYYLMEDISDDYTRYKVLNSGEKVCLDLNGHTIYAQHASYGRVFSLSAGSTLSIMDSVGTGQIIGIGSKISDSGSATSGGVISVYGASGENPAAELNLYSGAIRRSEKEAHGADYGGTIYCAGVFNLYGGTVDAGRSLINGGTIHMTKASTLNMSGGTIVGGKANKSYDGLDCYRGVVNITGGTITGAANLDTQANISGLVKIDNLRATASRPLQIGTLEEGSQISIIPTSQGFITNANGGSAENAKYFTNASTSLYVSAEKGGLFAGDKWACECGGTKPAGHTCQEVAWKAWTSTTSMPISNGNYYMTNDVTTAAEQYPAENSYIRLDLNGHDITFKIPASKAPTWSETEKAWKSNTRVLNLYRGCDYVLTDSTKNPGVVSRDTSALTEEEISHITNYGVLVLINGADKNGVKQPTSFTLYNGILDGTGSRTTGAGMISVHSSLSKFYMYGGKLQGGTANCGGAIFAAGGSEVLLAGGEVLSGTALKGYGECVYSDSAKSLVLMGDADVQQIYFSASDTSNALSIQGKYTGTLGLRFTKVSTGKVIGTAVNADISNATISCLNDLDMQIVAENGQLKLRLVDKNTGAVIPNGNTEQTFQTAQAAVDAYTGGLIILQKNDAGTLTIPAGKTVYLDLNGRSLTNVKVNGKLYVRDSMTDDFSVADGVYGRITGTVTGTVNPVPVENGAGYVKLTESDKKSLSFHAVELWVGGMALNPEQAGVSYLCNFRGDERVSACVAGYGMALSLAGVPTVSDGSFTKDCLTSNFIAFAAGAAGNTKSSTQLEGVMKKGNTVAVNRINAAMSVYGRPYIKLTDGNILLGDAVDFSLRDLVVMADETPVWETFSDAAVAALTQMYKDFKAVMQTWEIPNLKAAVR